MIKAGNHRITMIEWINDHIESVIASILAFFAGVLGTGKLFFGLKRDMGDMKNDMGDLKDEQAQLRSEVEQMKRDAAEAKGQREQLIQNTRLILKKIVGERE